MKKPRPQTPLITISNKTLSPNNTNKPNNEYYLKNFSNFLKQIIDNKNEQFLNGEKSLISYLLSKYLSIPESYLQKIKKLSILINHDYGLLNQFGKFLPSLELLKLNNSNILTFNNIGANFKNIKCLQMKNCHLKDLDGLICLQNLEILDIEGNEINDLVDVDMCENIKKFNVKNNKIENEDNFSYVSGMINLEYFDVRENPIFKNEKNFKLLIKKFGINEKIIVWNSKNECDVVGMFDENIEDEVFDNNNNNFNNFNLSNNNNNYNNNNRLRVNARKNNNVDDDDNDVIIQDDEYSNNNNNNNKNNVNNNKRNNNNKIENKSKLNNDENNNSASDITLETIIKNAKSSKNIFKDMSFDSLYKDNNNNNKNNNNNNNLLNSQSSININNNNNKMNINNNINNNKLNNNNIKLREINNKNNINNKNININYNNNFFGVGGWGFGVGGRAPNPQSPIPIILINF